LRFSYLGLSNAGIIGMFLHTQLQDFQDKVILTKYFENISALSSIWFSQ
jgi:hypothetical protein